MTGSILRAQKKLRHQKMTPMVGDRVRFTPGQGGEDGWLEEILPRKSMMERPSVANVDMLMLVVASVPQPDMLLCDKLILRAEKGGMIPAICVNKIDLGDELAEQIRREYVGTQLRVFSVSAREGTGVSQLRDAMRGKVTCLAGQSAVGKSSLLNALFGLGLETGGLSRKTERAGGRMPLSAVPARPGAGVRRARRRGRGKAGRGKVAAIQGTACAGS